PREYVNSSPAPSSRAPAGTVRRAHPKGRESAVPASRPYMRIAAARFGYSEPADARLDPATWKGISRKRARKGSSERTPVPSRTASRATIEAEAHRAK